MTYRRICARCGAGFSSPCNTAKYCEACRPAIQRERMRHYNAERREFTARANAIAGRVDFNGCGKGRRAQA